MKKEEIGYKAELIEKSIRLIRASLPKTQERFLGMGLPKTEYTNSLNLQFRIFSMPSMKFPPA
ncbi:hypothetical protein [Thermococcus sp. 2319x1]|uniref:hypothetical protein n=1 Tax=Thermococcus sp. 2319x1 TaxID=1674923 RepID=UPI001E4D9735|nr:hypothetical protein [Thermococcus sp. 2319x1]